MHQNSTIIMKTFSENVNKNLKLSILDVGSYNVNGTYKPFFENENWTYSGLDIVEGPNVDIIVDKYGEWKNIPDNSYDIVISGQCLEHTETPWLISKAIVRVLKPDGVIFIIVPYKQGIHRYPIDCWRILPDGMQYLFCKCESLEKWVCGVKKDDCFFCGSRGQTATQIANKEKIKSIWIELATKDNDIRIFR